MLRRYPGFLLIGMILLSVITACSSAKQSWEKSFPIVFKPGPKQIGCEIKRVYVWNGNIYFDFVNVSDAPIDKSKVEFQLYDSSSKLLAKGFPSTEYEKYLYNNPPFDPYGSQLVRFSPTNIKNPTSFKVFLDGTEIFSDSLTLIHMVGVPVEQVITDGFCNVYLERDTDDTIEKVKQANATWEKFLSELNVRN